LPHILLYELFLTGTQGNKLATPYAKAVMSMLPKTSYREGEQNTPHEPVNEVHVHKLTMQQLFVPVSESRRFTREDAAKAFHETMLSADKRSPQPELIKMEREILEGKRSREEGMERFKEATQREEDAVARRIVKQHEEEERRTGGRARARDGGTERLSTTARGAWSRFRRQCREETSLFCMMALYNTMSNTCTML